MKSIATVIFSKDRALQLQGTLDSFRLHCIDVKDISIVIIYRATTPEFSLAYQMLRREQAGLLRIMWVEEQEFKKDLLRSLAALRPRFKFVLFLVDDCIFVRSFCIKEISQIVDGDKSAIGYSLRLGLNTTYCYSEDRPQPLPRLVNTGGNLRFQWPNQAGDFGYPLEISSSLYRSHDILPLLYLLPYTNPNNLEQFLAQLWRLWSIWRPWLWCAEQSLAFCAPVNLVQNTFKNRAGLTNHKSAGELNSLFLAGNRMDVSLLRNYTPSACHEEIELPLKLADHSDQDQGAIAVLICALPDARPEWLEAAIKSTARGLRNSDAIFLLIDGGLLSSNHTLLLQQKAYPINLYIESLPRRRGLAACLNFLIEKVLNDSRFTLIARMDADDICMADRFNLQRSYMSNHADIDILGSWCKEVDERENLIQIKRMPLQHDEIVRHLPIRNPMNHPTVLIRKDVFTSGLRYRTDVGRIEDYHLWIEAAESGWRLANMPELLLSFRRDQSFFRRRSGLRQAFADMQVRYIAMKALNQWSAVNLVMMFAAGSMRLLPGSVQRRLYRLRGTR